jgi:hypothetical protein
METGNYPNVTDLSSNRRNSYFMKFLIFFVFSGIFFILKSRSTHWNERILKHFWTIMMHSLLL